MIWLEMARDETHGGGSWGFGESLWSPIKKENGSRWPYWTNVSLVKAGDAVIHLRGKEHKSYFVGYSFASDDGYKTAERPLHPGPWGYATEFFRVPLKDFTAFESPLKLDDFFATKDRELRQYFEKNKQRRKSEKRSLFYVIQSNTLRCQNGAYLSEVEDELADLILGSGFSLAATRQPPQNSTDTGTASRLLQTRVGQNRFSQNVRDNYNHTCCFPGCTINEDRFLIGSHIARWTDAPHLRGETANGLCLCLMHDKAFEIGLFTLTNDFRVSVTHKHPLLRTMAWFKQNLTPFDGELIARAPIPPDPTALELHRQRIRNLVFNS